MIGMIGSIVDVGVLRLRVLRFAPYADAHPGETYLGECDSCVIAERLDTSEEVLLWLCDGINWAVSRHDRDYFRHRTDSGA
jgi:hypothetical protein